MQVIPGIEFSAEYYVPSWDDITEIHVVGIFPNGVNPPEFDWIFSKIDVGKEAYIQAILADLYHEIFISRWTKSLQQKVKESILEDMT